jgi:hypothetical protein
LIQQPFPEPIHGISSALKFFRRTFKDIVKLAVACSEDAPILKRDMGGHEFRRSISSLPARTPRVLYVILPVVRS